MKTFLTSIMISATLLFSIKTNAQDVGDKAPNFNLDVLGGGTFNLSNYSGKVVFIFFFGYNCPHCKSNGPNTQSDIYNVYNSNSDFVAVGVDTWDGNSSGVSSFQQTTGISYQLCLKGSSLEDLYETTYDRIVVVDKDGIIKFKSTSNSTSDVVADASDVIDDLLSGNSGMGGMGDGDGGSGDGTVTAIGNPNEQKLSLKLYPVPTRNQLTIESPYLAQADFNIKVYDMAGKNTFETRVAKRESGQVSIPMDEQHAGLHVIQLTSRNKTMVEKFLIGK